MSIYPSSKVLPYVYQCIHKTTGKIYIGSRIANNTPSHLDFPHYRTSSRYVKPIFEEFNWRIIAEFFNSHDAYDFEQQLIHEQWLVSKEISLNRICNYGKKSFNMIGKESHRKGKKLPKEHIRNLSKSHKNKPRLDLKGIPKSEDHKLKLKNSNTGKSRPDLKGIPRTAQHKRNMSKIIDVLTPYGFVIENTTMKELCSQFNLNYGSLKRNFSGNGQYKSYKGFIRIF